MENDNLNKPVHQVLSDYSLLQVQNCDDIRFSLDYPLPFKLNLCAISQTDPTKYIIAVRNEIRIYGFTGGRQFTQRPIMILKPSTQHDFIINSIKVGFMMLHPDHHASEILVVVGDNGEVFAWDTPRLFSKSEMTGDERKRPFFTKVNLELAENEASEGASTWGIAIHTHGLLAVSANNHRITIYNLWKSAAAAAEIKNSLGDRGQVDLAGHLDNVPSIDFDSTGRYLASGSIDMTCRLWDLSNLQQIGKRSMTRTLGEDAWLWSVKFIPPGNFKHAKCINSSLSKTIHQRLDQGRSTSILDLDLVHSAPFPIFQLDMGRVFSHSNIEDYYYSDGGSGDDEGTNTTTIGINQHVIDLNDGTDDWNDPPDITRLIRLSNFLAQHLRQQQRQQSVPQTDNNAETNVLEPLDPSPINDDLLHRYEEEDNDIDNTDPTTASFDNEVIDENDDADNIYRTTGNDDNDTYQDELYDTYTGREGHHHSQEGQSGFSDYFNENQPNAMNQVLIDSDLDDDLDALFERFTPPVQQQRQQLDDQEDADLLYWEDQYNPWDTSPIDERDDAFDEMDQAVVHDVANDWQEYHTLETTEDYMDDNDDATDYNDYDINRQESNDSGNSGWGSPTQHMNQREDYEDTMMEAGSWMEDQTMFPWHWTGIRASNEQDDRENESIPPLDQHHDRTGYQTFDNGTEQSFTTAFPFINISSSPISSCPSTASLNPTVLAPPLACLSINSSDHDMKKIPTIFDSTKPSSSSSDIINKTINHDNLQDYLLITTKKDAYLLNVSHEPSSSSTSSLTWPATVSPTKRHAMTTIQRERHAVSRADFRTDDILDMMDRIAFVEWIPELELCVMASQKGCVALMRILQVQLEGGNLQTCMFNHEKYLPLHGIQNSGLYGMTVHRLPSDDQSRHFSSPVYQLLLLYLDGSMRSYLIFKNHQPQVSSSSSLSKSSSHSLIDLYSVL